MPTAPVAVIAGYVDVELTPHIHVSSLTERAGSPERAMREAAALVRDAASELRAHGRGATRNDHGMAAHRGPPIRSPAMASQVEVDPQETREWLEALDAVVNSDGPQRAQFLLERVVGHAQLTGAAPAPAGTTPYLNTIPPQDEPAHPVDRGARAASTVDRPLERDRDDPEREQDELGARRPHRQLPVGGRPLRDRASTTSGARRATSTAATSSTCRATRSPGVYARAFLEGRIPEEQMRKFRMEVGGDGLSLLPASVADAGLLAVPHGLAWASAR